MGIVTITVDSDIGVCSIDNYPDIQSLMRAAIKKHPVVSSTASKQSGTCPPYFLRVKKSIHVDMYFFSHSELWKKKNYVPVRDYDAFQMLKNAEMSNFIW